MIFAVALNLNKILSEVFMCIFLVEISKGGICSCNMVDFEYRHELVEFATGNGHT